MPWAERSWQYKQSSLCLSRSCSVLRRSVHPVIFTDWFVCRGPVGHWHGSYKGPLNWFPGDAGGWRVWILLHHRAYATPPEHTKQTQLGESSDYVKSVLRRFLRCYHTACSGMKMWSYNVWCMVFDIVCNFSKFKCIDCLVIAPNKITQIYVTFMYKLI